MKLSSEKGKQNKEEREVKREIKRSGAKTKIKSSKEERIMNQARKNETKEKKMMRK
jgi:hypothetical protein